MFRLGKDDFLKFKAIIRVGKTRIFNIKCVVGGRAAGRVSEPAADLLGFSRTSISKGFGEWSKMRKYNIDVKGQRSGWADWFEAIERQH